ncbi:MAG: hypothetical protein A2Y33_10120 [Spirochaetes bacterium GWF1_51_8]|nr:MAG: hypothetical protein A2Y33_10120 [Spirochaetes bacterium GWF1_51_8]
MSEEIRIEGFTRDDFPNARVTRGSANVTLHSIQPYKEAERIASRLNPGIEWYFVAGFGMGYIVETLLKNPSAQILVFEPLTEIIDHAKSSRDLTKLLSDKRLHIIGDVDEIVPFLESRDIREVNYYLHRPYSLLFPEIFTGMEGILTSYLSKRQINKNTLKRFRMVWLRNMIKNLRYYYALPGINHLRHPFAGKPALIVGAGPSLAKNIEAIAESADRMAIIATDTALPMLGAYGIVPDFTVSADPQDKNTLYLLYSGNPATTLVIDAAGSFLTFSKFRPARTFLYDSFFPIYRELSPLWGEKGDLKSGGSVSTTAFDLARFLKCSPIIFAGQDLAFSGKKTHFHGNVLEDFLFHRIDRLHTYDNYHSRTLIFSDRIMIDGYAGGKVPTDRKFLTFLEWFKREIAATGVPVVNATEGGAFIPGAEHIPFAEVRAKYLASPIDKTSTVEYTAPENPVYPEYFLDVAAECARLIPLAQAAYSASLRAADDFRWKRDISGNFKPMNDFDRAVLTALKAGNAVSRFIELAMQESIERIMDSSSNSKEISGDIIDGWKGLYGDALLSLRKVRHLLSKAEALSSS